MPLENWRYKIPLRLRSLFKRNQVEQDLDDELHDHLERETAARIRQGMSPADASRGARLALGGVEQQKEAVRDARGVRPLEELAGDIRYAFRSLRRNPGFTATAIAVLGLGIGASAAVFGVLDAVVWSDLPYPGADRLVRIYEKNSPTNLWTLSTVDYQAIHDQQKSFDALGAVRFGDAGLSGAGAPERILLGRATSGFFTALGIQAQAGRLVEPTDEPVGALAVAVVTHALAERVLGGGARAVGRSITIDGVSHTVIGVLPAGRNDLANIRASAWSALQLAAPTRRGPFGMRGYARLRPGITLEAATRDLAGISERIFPIWASSFQDQEAKLTPVPLREAIIGKAGRPVGLFGAAVGLVLLIAIANVGTLMLVRTSAREQELAVRAALGAARPRLARLVVAECLALTFAAGLVGVGLAAASSRLVAALTTGLPRHAAIGMSLKVAGFAVIVALVAGMLVSLSPVAMVTFKAAGLGIAPDVRRAGTGRASHRTRAVFVVLEFALALPLLLGAGLLLQSFVNLERVNPGFDPAGAGAVNLAIPATRYSGPAEIQAFWQRVLDRVEQAPGIAAVGLATALPPDDPGDENNFDLVSHPVEAGTAQPVSPWVTVSNGYFKTLGIPLLDGRLFTAADTGNAPVVVVSRAWAAHYLPGETAIGQRLIEGGCTACPRTTIVGVVGDVRYLGLAGLGDAVYQPVSQSNWRSMYVVARSRAGGPVAGAFRVLRSEIAAVDADLPLVETQLAERLNASLGGSRRAALVLGAFAGVAVFLAALGIFGLMSFAVRQRRREIGVRIALGAQPHAVTRMIVVRGMRYALVGTAIGIALAALQVRWLRTQLFQVAPGDPLALLAAGGVLLLAGFLASWLPGRKAARIRALEAISSE